tara:strand:- start:6768 stop:7460 length:693 start_codon:yes stop_codon:yes gene_type:complete
MKINNFINTEEMGDWAEKLSLVSIRENWCRNMSTFLQKRYAFFHVYPEKQNIFKAFKLTQFKDLKVVIINQHPYTDERATGLAFANNESKNSDISPSLRKIEKCIESKVKDGLYFMDYDLENWAKQGVLLMNAALTVEKDKPNSHNIYWNHFTEKVIETINMYHSGVIFLFIGRGLAPYVKTIDTNRHYVLKYEKPATAIIKNKDWNCPHFNTINKIIEENNGKEFKINW